MPKKFDPKYISGQVLCGAIKEHQLSLNEILARSLRQHSSPILLFLVSHVVIVDALLGHFSVRADSCSILQGRAAPVHCPALGLHQPAVGVCERRVAVWCHPPEPDRRRDGGNRRLDGQRAHSTQVSNSRSLPNILPNFCQRDLLHDLETQVWEGKCR